MSGKEMVFMRRGLSSIPKLNFNDYTEVVNFSHNPITSFKGLPTLDGKFRKLILSDTKITSFVNAKEQPNIEELSMKQTTLGVEKYFPLMALIVFGDQLKKINGFTVTDELRNESNKCKPALYDLLLDGFILKSKAPYKLVNPETNRKATATIDDSKQKNQTDNSEIQDEIEIFADESAFQEEEENAEKEKTFDDIRGQLRYRFNELIYPPTDSEKKKTTPKKRTPTKESYRSAARPPLIPPSSPSCKIESPYKKAKIETEEKKKTEKMNKSD